MWIFSLWIMMCKMWTDEWETCIWVDSCVEYFDCSCWVDVWSAMRWKALSRLFRGGGRGEEVNY